VGHSNQLCGYKAITGNPGKVLVNGRDILHHIHGQASVIIFYIHNLLWGVIQIPDKRIILLDKLMSACCHVRNMA
jgi:hypothetical protein